MTNDSTAQLVSWSLSYPVKTCQKRPTSLKRDLQKRPTKETYKKDLQKRPTKETYKRDLQKRPKDDK